MSTQERYKILFEPVDIGPVTAPNRFYQVPHCTGLGWNRPRMVAELRGIKAEGGWGVVCTEYCSIHPSSDDSPFAYSSLWDQGDIRANALVTEKVHKHGALAGVELWAGGASASNNFSREASISLGSVPTGRLINAFPRQTRSMDRRDIRNLRKWHRDAALRAREAGFDIVYVYATHGYLLSGFLSSETNQRSDEYGGSLENRCRLVRELIEETLEAVGDKCAVAVRFSVDDGGGGDGKPVHNELRDRFESMAELPDLWDINVDDYSLEMGVSRFIKEGALEPYMSFVKSATTKPVVTVGRFTSPDTMASQVRRGIVDFIGAARPSIADPFLPEKIRNDRIEAIRECIGCNICYASDGLAVPIRCTQNPTMGEEWRRGWHPESVPTGDAGKTVLVVGAGPCGLEAARVAGERGYQVMLAEASRHLGGRVSAESTLPGLQEWARVRDYRVQQLQQMNNVEVFLESDMSAQDILELSPHHVAIATGSRWRTDTSGRHNRRGIEGLAESPGVYSVEQAMVEALPEGNYLVYDDDHYHMASSIAEKLALAGNQVCYVTPADRVAVWSIRTVEQYRVHGRLHELGVRMITAHLLTAFDGTRATLGCVFTDVQQAVDAQFLVPVTARLPMGNLYHDLAELVGNSSKSEPFSFEKIGDCDTPGLIADAVFSGHRWGRELDCEVDRSNPMKYDRVFYVDN